MKTKIYIKFLLILSIFVNSNLKAETIFFDSKNIKIEENGNMLFATKGIAQIPSKSLNIVGDKFIYDKTNSELTIFDENDIDYCRSGLDYHKSDESLLTKTKKKEKKFGFFERFFNFFSK